MKPRVLCVDDEAEEHKWYAKALRPEYVVLKAMGGGEALDILQSTGSRSAIDVVISDQNMRDISGVELTIRMREAGIETPVLIVTNADPRWIRNIARQAGAYDVVHKMAQLYKPVLEQILRQGGE